jgi:hypothetical protein
VTVTTHLYVGDQLKLVVVSQGPRAVRYPAVRIVFVVWPVPCVNFDFFAIDCADLGLTSRDTRAMLSAILRGGVCCF